MEYEEGRGPAQEPGPPCPFMSFMRSLSGSSRSALIGVLVILTEIGFLLAQDERSLPAGNATGFVDRNRDGVNDLFCDTNGDGINDVTGRPYDHKFDFADADGDRMNDLWRDADGDGVNDLCARMDTRVGGEIDAIVLDVDQDGANDVTGAPLRGEGYSGHLYGFIDERSGSSGGRLLDEDGNGIDDRLERMRMGAAMSDRDLFIDEDGDGICDGRGDMLRRRGRRGGGHHGGDHGP